jgi:hypothetical protein
VLAINLPNLKNFADFTGPAHALPGRVPMSRHTINHARPRQARGDPEGFVAQMSVTVDQNPLPAETLGLKTVGQVLAHLKRRDRLVVRVLIDGHEPDLKRIRVVKKFPLTGHAVQIETADPRQMARAVLAEVEQELTEAHRLTKESSALLQNNQVAPAIENLAGCFTTWQHVQDALLKTAQLLRIEPAAIKVGGRALTELLGDVRAHLAQVRDALEGRDFNTLADLLAHKMTRAAEQWRDAIRSFRGVICV